MKALAFSLIIALGCAAPALAQAPDKSPPAQTNAAPAVAPIADEAAPLDVEAAVTLEDRAALIRRCAGPPPKAIKSAIAKNEPMSEPAVIADAGPGGSGG